MASEGAANDAPVPHRRPGPARDYGLGTAAGKAQSEPAAHSYGLSAAPTGGAARDRPSPAPPPSPTPPSPVQPPPPRSARPQPPPAPPARAPRDQAPASGAGGQAERAAADDPIEARPRPAPAERVEVPGPPAPGRVGPLERAVITAVTASIATRVLLSLLGRRGGGRRGDG